MEIQNKEIRRRIVEMGSKLGFGHYCSAMSCVDACVYLYDKVLTKDDVFIMGKGHGIIAVLPILEKLGKKVEWKPYLDYDPENGIEATTGSLGHGLPIAVGRAFAKKLKGEKGKVYVMVGDGEIQEGSNWEALMIARKLKLDNLIVLVDWNKYQAVSSVKDVMDEDSESLKKQLNAFGCAVTIINGHDESELSWIKDIKIKDSPHAFILDTIKGKGIKFLEEHPSYHVLYFNERPEVLKQTLEDLK